MIHPDLFGVRTLIFDMDGTLVSSAKMAVASLNGALAEFFRKRNLEPPTFTDKDLYSWLGAPVNDFYRSILPEPHKDDWPEFHQLAAIHERNYLQAKRIAFPGALGVLDELRRRGYKLALVSNCNREYLDDVLDTQNLRERLDLATCIGDKTGSTKADRLTHVLAELGGPAVMIGDRFYDVEAAHACKIPAVGALYGYGGREELKDTSTWVGDVRELLDLFDPLRELAEKIAGVLNEKRRNEHPIFVSLTAPHAVVTSPLLLHLFNVLSEQYAPAVHIPLDLHRTGSLNDLAMNPVNVDEFYPWERLRKAMREGRASGYFEVTLPLTDSGAGSANVGSERTYRARGGAVVLVNGPFQLQRDGWPDEFDAAYAVNATWRTVTTQLCRLQKQPDTPNMLPVTHLADVLLDADAETWKTLYEAYWKRGEVLAGRTDLELIINGDRLQMGAATKPGWE